MFTPTGWLYKWSASGMLIRVVNPQQGKIKFDYDALRQRTKKIVKNNIYHYLWDGNVVLHEWVETGLAYNRFRYYDPHSWVDVLGLKCGDRNTRPHIEDGNSKEGWAHIDARHVTGDHPNGAGDLFAAGTTRVQLYQAAATIVKKGHRVTEDINKVIQVFEKKIVVNGKQDLVRVVVDTFDANRVITRFPVR